MSSTDHRNGDQTGLADDRLGDLIADYILALEDGNPPDREELIARHPDLADDLREFITHYDRVEELLDPLRSAAARVLNVRCPHCHRGIELLDEIQITDISCPACGSNFSLVGNASTRHYPSGLKRIGQFQLVEQVGMGQFGSVWKARDLTLERTVAIKIPRSQNLSEDDVELFLRDARLAAQLKHPNIVPVHEVGRQNETVYIVSDFIQGATLKEWIAAKRLTHREATELCVKVAKALHHAHESGVIHRDLKPGNIMLDLQGQPHIVDFGLAKRDSDEITMTLDGQILGTPAYMSPEQARGEGHHVDRRADVYSFGVLLFELLTGELPFRGDKQMLIVQIQQDDPPRPRRLDNTVARDLETICLKCLRKESAKRYPTAQALADDLERWLEGEPILARPVSGIEKSWMWCRRRPAISSLLALLVVVVFSAVFISREVQQRERADGLVEQLLTAEMDEVPELVEQMLPDRRRVLPLLQGEDVQAAVYGSADKRIRASLARLALDGDVRHADYLYERLLTATPLEFSVICDALESQQQKLVERLWTLATTPAADADRRFRACCALAAYDPLNDRWDQIATFLAYRLVSVPHSELAIWQDQLRPVRKRLLDPLKEVFQNDGVSVQYRNFAADCLAKYQDDQSAALFALLMESSEEQFSAVIPRLARRRQEFARLLHDELQRPAVDEANPDTLDPGGRVENERLAVRRALAAIAAFQINLPDLASPALQYGPDPRARTRFIHWAAHFGVDPHSIISQFSRETDASVRGALLQALSEYKPGQLSTAEREELSGELLAVYRDAPDAGLRGAAEWLLRHWGCEDRIAEADQELARSQPDERNAIDALAKQWYLTTQGHSMVIIRPGVFLMGAPNSAPRNLVTFRKSEPDRPRHQASIGRCYAIASKEATRKQFERFLKDQNWNDANHSRNPTSPADDCPQNFVNWYQAAQYCNWLSLQEGIPENELAYLPNAEGEYADGMQTAPNFPACKGYRLPTEAEWAFACRAGTITLRFWGEGDEFLPHYAWYDSNSGLRMRPVGLLKPNNLGLFDMLGNAIEWCHDHGEYYRDRPYLDQQPAAERIEGDRVLRGGQFSSPSRRVDSADRAWHAPSKQTFVHGFRVARTIVPAPQDLAPGRWAEGLELGQQGKWREAAESMQAALPYFPQQVSSWYHTNLVWRYLGEMDQVDANCEEMLSLFGQTDNAKVAHVLASASLQHPLRDVTPQIEQLVELSLQRQHPNYDRDRGLMLYRRGEFESAEVWLTKASMPSLTSYSRLYSLYYLALARWQRGNEEGARETLREATCIRDEASHSFTEADYSHQWYEWLGAEASRREAERTMSTQRGD